LSYRQICRLASLTALAMACTACGTTGSASSAERNPDPFEKVNRAIYRFNETADRYVARPAAKAYRATTPEALRKGIGNFFANARYPITIVNDLLQGKLRQGGADLGRFLMNTTVGLGGLFDPATEAGLEQHDEDFGETLAVWGVPQGPYLMVPVFGPYTVASGIGDLVGAPANAINWNPDTDQVTLTWAGYLLHRRSTLIGIDEEVDQAFDPYLFVRDAYLQNRQYKILDGAVPEEELLPEDEFGGED